MSVIGEKGEKIDESEQFWLKRSSAPVRVELRDTP